MKLKTGIEKLDELLDGGMEQYSSTLIFSNPLVDKSTFVQHICSVRVLEGDKIIYVTSLKRADDIKRNLKEHGWDEKDFIFIDCIARTIEKPTTANYVLEEKLTNVEKAFEKLKELIFKVIEEVLGFKFFVFDSLETFMSVGSEKIIEVIKEIEKVSKGKKITSIFLLTNWGYSEEEINKLKNCVDNFIELGVIEKKLIWNEYFTVKRVNSINIEGKPKILFTITLTGVNIYIPKILITGPYHAGKSSTIHALSERAVSVNKLGTTIALDHGYMEKKGLACDLFGTPGQERFDWILKILAKDIWGIILVVDSTKPETFGRAIEMLNLVREQNIPFVVFANKQDLPNALPPKEVAKRLGISEELVIGTSAVKKEGLEEGVKKLIDLIFKVK